jgi:hypothetical protein
MVSGAGYEYEDVKDLHLPVCFECQRGRMRAQAVKVPVEVHYGPLEKIGIDYKGNFATRTQEGFRGFFVIVDQGSGLVEAVLAKTKGIALDVLIAYKRGVVDKYQKTWRILQSDDDAIFTSRRVNAWLRDNSIEASISCPYIHSQNGLPERAVHSVMDRARLCMLIHSAPRRYWGRAVTYAVYVINRTPRYNQDVTPLEAVTGEIPDLSNLVPFYAPGVYYLSKEERVIRANSNKYNYKSQRSSNDAVWEAKAQRCRMIGYDSRFRSGFLVLNLESGRIIFRENVIFDERIPRSVLDEIPREEEDWELEEEYEQPEDLPDDDESEAEPQDDGERGEEYEYPYWPPLEGDVAEPVYMPEESPGLHMGYFIEFERSKLEE